MARAIKLAKTGAKSAYHALRAIASLTAPSASGATMSASEKAFAEIVARGARIDLVYADGDAGLDELERIFGPGGERALALPGVRKTILPSADHLLTARHARAGLRAVLLEGAASGKAKTRAA